MMRHHIIIIVFILTLICFLNSGCCNLYPEWNEMEEKKYIYLIDENEEKAKECYVGYKIDGVAGHIKLYDNNDKLLYELEFDSDKYQIRISKEPIKYNIDCSGE